MKIIVDVRARRKQYDAKMKPLYKLGRFKNRETGQTVNIWKMRRGSFDVLAYRPQGKRPVIIPESDFYSKKQWEKLPDYIPAN